MPRMNGFELCRRFRAHPVLKSMSFVILSGLDDYKERRQGIEAGADDFLPKTLPVRELLMRIRLPLQAVVDAMGWTRRGPVWVSLSSLAWWHSNLNASPLLHAIPRHWHAT
jgi:DNA-binding response OmpR family regulator